MKQAYLQAYLFLLITTALLLVACGEKTKVYGIETTQKQQTVQKEQPAQEVPEAAMPEPHQAAPEQMRHDAEVEIAMVAKRFAFNPSTITVKKGTKVKITATTADVPHGIAIPGYGINVPINPGTPAIIEFVADKAGTFEFYCSVYCGSGHGGMKGSLIVT